MVGLEVSAVIMVGLVVDMVGVVKDVLDGFIVVVDGITVEVEFIVPRKPKTTKKIVNFFPLLLYRQPYVSVFPCLLVMRG